jgi:hypothetical protein
VPLSIPRLAKAAAATGLALAPLLAIGMPAHAGTVPVQQREYWLKSLHVTHAWRTGEGAGVTVAVLGDGVDATQPDLSGSVIAGPDFTMSGRKAGGPHFGVVGTGLASLIAGHGHGAKNTSGQDPDGVYGIADDAKILSVRVTLSPGDPLWSNSAVTSRLPDAIASGIRYAVLHGASVIDLPPDPGLPGFSGWGDVPAIAGGSAAEKAAVAYAVSRDVLLVAPAGDNAQDGDAVNYPAGYPGVVVVGAFGKSFVKAPYSSRQSYVTLTAPGEDVVAASPTGYQTMNSTWAASAIAAGIAALVRSQFPDLTAAQVAKSMTAGTVYGRSRAHTDGSGYGTVDAQGALTQAATMSPPHAQLSALGALPRTRPVAPAVASKTSAITSDLVDDGIISVGALVVLLVPIGYYGSVMRRRDRRAALAAADRERAARSRPGYGGMLADPLLEFFGPQHARPADRTAGQRPALSPRYQPRPALSGRSTLSARPPAAIGQGSVGLTSIGPSSIGPSSIGSASTGQAGASSGFGTADAGAGSLVSAADAADYRGEFGAPDYAVNDDPATNVGAGDHRVTAYESTDYTANDYTANDYGDNDFGAAGYGSTDYGTTDFGAVDYGPAANHGPAAVAGNGGNGAARAADGLHARPLLAAPDAAQPAAQTPLPVRRPRPAADAHATRTDVSGAPPWEPAPRPTTALPWAVIPASPSAGPSTQRGGFSAPTRHAPPESLWDESPADQSAASRSLFEPAPVRPHGTDEQNGPAEPASGWQDSGQYRSETSGRPIYVWNPSATSAPVDPFGPDDSSR